MTFVKEAALACLAVLNGFTKTKAISNKTDRPAKKALANFTVCGNCDRPSHAQFHAWSFNPHCIHGLLGSRALAEVVSGKRWGAIRSPCSARLPLPPKMRSNGPSAYGLRVRPPGEAVGDLLRDWILTQSAEGGFGSGAEFINPFYEDRIRIGEQTWRTWDR